MYPSSDKRKAERSTCRRQLAPIEVGYLVATKSGKTVEERSFDALLNQSGKSSMCGTKLQWRIAFAHFMCACNEAKAGD